MPLDITVFDQDYRPLRELNLDAFVHGVLFKKTVTPEGYPALGMAQNEKEDITFQPDHVDMLLADVEKLIAYLNGEQLMSAEVKGRCMDFANKLKEMCLLAKEHGTSVDFVAGE